MTTRFKLILVGAAVSITLIALAVIYGIRHNKEAVPVTWHGVTLTNGCLADAIECFHKVDVPGVTKHILLIKYSTGGVVYGHAMTLFDWPGTNKSGNVWYCYDAAHSSMPIPSSVDPNSPKDVARYFFPSVISAWFAEPDSNHTSN